MGNGGSTCDTVVDTTNQCDYGVGDYTNDPMPGFCTILGVAGNSYRDEYCDKMSKAGEWGDSETVKNQCSYNWCNMHQSIGFGCCGGGCCGVVGGGLSCKRIKFTGDPVTCCFNDLKHNGDNPKNNPSRCYSDNAKQNTCSNGSHGQPNYRDLTSSDCQQVMTQYCTGTLPGDNPNSTEWLNRWSGDDSCVDVIRKNIFEQQGGQYPPVPDPLPGVCNNIMPLPVNAAGYYWAQQLITQTLRKYQQQGFVLGSMPGYVGYNVFQQLLYADVCCPYAGICQSGLDDYCYQFTAQQLSYNPNLANWCGCHMNTEEYQEYSVKYNISPQCTPMCNRLGTIPIVGTSGDPTNCEQDICLIDNVSVNLINAQIGGGVNFNQVCNNCPDASCSCISTDNRISVVNSTIGGNFVPIDQGCGSFSCIQLNPGDTGPNIIPVTCGTTGSNPFEDYNTAFEKAQEKSWRLSVIWTIVAIIVGLLLAYLIIIIFTSSKLPPEGASIERKLPKQTIDNFSNNTTLESISNNNFPDSISNSSFNSIRNEDRNFLPRNTGYLSINS